VPCEVSVVSAHRTPERMMEYAKTAHKRGIKVIIAGAGERRGWGQGTPGHGSISQAVRSSMQERVRAGCIGRKGGESESGRGHVTLQEASKVITAGAGERVICMQACLHTCYAPLTDLSRDFPQPI
jgi:hypothetical protein